jgi:DNA-binding GntR family transcriptional regulator
MAEAKDDPARRPRYRQIAAALLEDIRAGRYPVGQLLPVETELCARFGAGRHTVREALRIITEQGLVVRRAGMGSVVIAADPPVLFTHSVTSLAEWLRYPADNIREALGGAEVVADGALASLLKCEPGRRWFRIEALRRVAGQPVPLGWVEIYVLPKYAAVIERRDHGRTPVHEQIAKQFGETPERAQLEIFAGRMQPAMAERLQVEAGSPSLVVVRRYYGARAGLYEVTVTTHPEGRYTYVMDLERALRPVG